MKRSLAIVVALLLSVAANAATKEPEKKKFDPAEDINKPRPDARKITFSTSEGTWMSVDLSPDGTTLAFDLLGDIYTMPAAGGKATAITAVRRGIHIRAIRRTERRSRSQAIAAASTTSGSWPRRKKPARDHDGEGHVRALRDVVAGRQLSHRAPKKKESAAHPAGRVVDVSRARAARNPAPSKDDNEQRIGSGVLARRTLHLFSARKARFNYVPDLSHGLWDVYRYDRRTGDTVQVTGGNRRRGAAVDHTRRKDV